MNSLRMKLYASLALALLAGLGAFFFLQARERELLRRGTPKQIVIARHYIAASTRLEKGDFALTEIPSAFVPQGAVTDYREALGQLTLAPFSADEPILFNKISSGNATLANAVPEGKRAFTIPVDKVTGVGGMLRPGDLVDLLFMKDEGKQGGSQASILLQAVRVLAAGELLNQTEGKANTEGSVTLALAPDEAALVMLALSRGLLHLALRPVGDSRLLPVPAVNAGELSGRPLRKSAAGPAEEPVSAPIQEFIPKKR